MMLRARNRLVREGAHLVEFAVVIPVFFIFIFGLIEIGRGMMVNSLITNAARAGCRTGTLSGKTNSDVSAAVDELLSGQGVSGHTTTIKVNGSTSTNVSSAVAQDTIMVVVAVPAANTTWLPSVLYVKGTITGQFSLPHE
jgi:Flp pilus assembly protein TadG